MARINLKFQKDESGVIVGYYFNCEEADEDTFKAAKVAEGFTFVEKKDPPPPEEKLKD